AGRRRARGARRAALDRRRGGPSRDRARPHRRHHPPRAASRSRRAALSSRPVPMHYIVETSKSVEDAARDLDAAVKRNRFGVLHVYDLQETLRSKGVELPAECRIFEVCNPQQAGKVLAADMTLNMALPCRVSVYGEGGRTKIGM